MFKAGFSPSCCKTVFVCQYQRYLSQRLIFEKWLLMDTWVILPNFSNVTSKLFKIPRGVL